LRGASKAGYDTGRHGRPTHQARWAYDGYPGLLQTGSSTASLDLDMSWQPRFHHLKHPRRRPSVNQPRHYFKASQWSSMSELFLGLAIRKLATEEQLAVGPARARYRAKRLRAVEVFRRRFGEAPALKTYAMRQLPRLGQ
jgi:hypothetical protein